MGLFDCACPCSDCCYAGMIGSPCESCPCHFDGMLAGGGDDGGEEAQLLMCGIGLAILVFALVGGGILVAWLLWAEVGHKHRMCLARSFPAIDRTTAEESIGTQAPPAQEKLQDPSLPPAEAVGKAGSSQV